MPGKNRSYRKSLASYGLIYLGGEELEIEVKNLSITGMLAEIEGNDAIHGIKDVFHAIELSSIIDIYLPEMRLAGEAEITRADLDGGKVFLALEFRNLTYEVSNLLYKRKAYRKNITAPGRIVFNGKKHQFFTKNVSVGGMTIMLNERVLVQTGLVTIFDFKKLDLRGEIEVVWVEYVDEDFTLMGLKYKHIGTKNIRGIPNFLSDHDEDKSYW
ncbi:MAG: PilZ domain-containing protein [Methylococcaceae bacterium]|nr:PilZ domain-containing protein [Methylococcaceae bacterium]